MPWSNLNQIKFEMPFVDIKNMLQLNFALKSWDHFYKITKKSLGHAHVVMVFYFATEKAKQLKH